MWKDLQDIQRFQLHIGQASVASKPDSALMNYDQAVDDKLIKLIIPLQAGNEITRFRINLNRSAGILSDV